MKTPLTPATEIPFRRTHEVKLEKMEKCLDLIMEHLGLEYEEGPRLKQTRRDYGPPPIHGTDTAI